MLCNVRTVEGEVIDRRAGVAHPAGATRSVNVIWQRRKEWGERRGEKSSDISR